jgi:uncharacterized protein YcfL
MKKIRQLLLLLSVLFLQNAYCQTTVYVQTNQFGRGILKIRGSECYVITPNHLLKNYNGPINVFGEGSVRSRADLLKSYVGDLAILRFTGDNNHNCTKWHLNKNYSSVIESISEGFIEMRDKDGSSSKFAVSITGVDVQYITIRPKDFREKFYQGMSGSSLFVNYQGEKVFLGMLQSISDDETGSVIKADEMDKLLDSFFNPIERKKRSNVISDKDLTKEVLDFRFELLDIYKSGDRVTFTFDVTSLKSDKVLRLSNYDIFLYDDKGLESKPNNIVIGNKTNNIVDYNMVQGISVPMKITFTGIPSSAQFATLLKVGFSDKETKSDFEFRELYFGDEPIEEMGNWSKDALGFKYDLLDYDKIGTDVVFTFTITSLDKDKVIRLNNYHIYLYDNNGLEYKPNNIIIGNQSNNIVEYNLIQGIQVPLIFSFKNIASSATGVSLLKIGFSDKQNESNIQIRNLTFTKAKTNNDSNVITKNDNNSTAKNVSEKSSSCSELYFYRKNGVLECEETVLLYNHGEFLAKLEPGTRFKSIVCDDRSFKLTVKLNPNDLAFSVSKPEIVLGGNYYFKIGCAVGVATISIQENKKGVKDITNNGKFKRKLQILALTEY